MSRVFHELASGGISTDGVPANPCFVNAGCDLYSPEDKTTLLAEIRGRRVSDRHVPADRCFGDPITARRHGRRRRPCPSSSPGEDRPGWLGNNDRSRRAIFFRIKPPYFLTSKIESTWRRNCGDFQYGGLRPIGTCLPTRIPRLCSIERKNPSTPGLGYRYVWQPA